MGQRRQIKPVFFSYFEAFLFLSIIYKVASTILLSLTPKSIGGLVYKALGLKRNSMCHL
jgi:hypothetical protein